jgi:ABC-2 type transport system permease protein
VSAVVASSGTGSGSNSASGSGHGVPGTLVRLKLRLLVNRAKSSKGGVVQVLVACLLALTVGGIGALLALAAGLAHNPQINRDVIVLGATAIALGWAVLPLISFGSDESLDPARLVLFPLRKGPLMRGLLLTSFVGPAPATVVIIVMGAVIGYSSGIATVVVIVAMGLLLALSAATARTLTTALAAGLTSRRGRDAMIVLVSVLALSIQGLRFLHYSSDFIEHLVDILRWLPPGMLGQSVIDARNGDLLLAIVELVPAAVLIPLLLGWWASALDRSMTVVTGGESKRRKHTEAGGLPLMFARLPFLDGRSWGAVAAKELRYVTREPRRKVTLVNSVLIGVGLPVYVAIRSGGESGSRAVLLATVSSYIAIIGSSNQFGLDGPAVWLDMVAGDTMRTVLVGKNVAVALEVLPIVTVVGAFVAAVTGGWIYLPAAILLASAGLGVGLATADVISVRFPFKLPENRSPFAGSGGGQGCTRSLILMGCALAQNVLLLPVVGAVAVAAFVGSVWLIVVVPLAVAYGAGMWIFGVHVATEWGRERSPEILIAVDPARTG